MSRERMEELKPNLVRNPLKISESGKESEIMLNTELQANGECPEGFLLNVKEAFTFYELGISVSMVEVIVEFECIKKTIERDTSCCWCALNFKDRLCESTLSLLLHLCCQSP